MATAYKPPVEQEPEFKADPRPDLDRKAFRKDFMKRYENTLRYLGR